MIDDSIISMVAIGLTLLCLGLVNGFQFASTQLAAGSLPQVALTSDPVSGRISPVVRPGALITAALGSWVSKLGLEHPLLGRTWSADRQEWVLPDEIVRAATDADIVLIGETHDNPDHHKLQAYLIRQLAERGKHPTVVMEMISADKTDAVASYQVSNNATPDGLGSVVDWDNSDWPAWTMYRPIVEAAMGAGDAIIPGDPSKAQINQVKDLGLNALPQGERDRLAVNRNYPPKFNAILSEEVKQVHCGLMPDAIIPKLVDAQRFRDAVLADSLLRATQKTGSSAVLIAGAGHLRSDLAVPYYVHLRAPGLKIVTVLLKEVETGQENPDESVPRDADGKPTANFVWFTARTERTDQCAELKNRLQSQTKNTAG